MIIQMCVMPMRTAKSALTLAPILPSAAVSMIRFTIFLLPASYIYGLVMVQWCAAGAVWCHLGYVNNEALLIRMSISRRLSAKAPKPISRLGKKWSNEKQR